MIRRALITAAILIPTALAFAHPSTPQGAHGPELKVEKINEKIHVIQGAGGNIAVLSGDDGVLVVDNGMQASSPEVMAAIRAISDKPIRFVINTHWHPDHTGANATVGANTTIVAHDRTRGWLKRGTTIDGTTIPPAPLAALPNLTIQNETRLYLNGEMIQVLPLVGGHTDGDIFVSFTESNVVHLGDIFFADRFPFIDAGSGGSVRQLAQNLDYLVKLVNPNARLIPGHGPVSSVEGLKKFASMVNETSALVITAKHRGESVETMKKNKLLEPWNGWSWDFIPTDRFIEVLDKATPEIKARRLPRSKKKEPATETAPAPIKN